MDVHLENVGNALNLQEGQSQKLNNSRLISGLPIDVKLKPIVFIDVKYYIRNILCLRHHIILRNRLRPQTKSLDRNKRPMSMPKVEY